MMQNRCQLVIVLVALVGISWMTLPTQFSRGNEVQTQADDTDKDFEQNSTARTLPDTVSFNAHIRPIMSNTCFTCHGPDVAANESGIRLDSFEAAVDVAAVIIPGNTEDSIVYQRLTDQDDPMPPADFRHQLSDHEKELFKNWIEQGAKYQKHWAYSPINEIKIPTVKKSTKFVANPVDSFVLAKLDELGIAPTESADKNTLLRRLSLDLIGLPPTPKELKRFLEDHSDDAYEKQVDRLLASPHYGERMASRWLDIVRFSDTVGFHGDQNQRIFPYRDFVIDSINQNQRFDDFTRDQLAGDLLNDPTEQQLIATGLVRLNMMTREGGAQPEEYLAKYAADRVRMVGTAWLGSTLGCCECHNHKYDPYSTKDFYSLGAFFDDVRQWGVYSDYGYTPNPDLRGFNNDFPFPPEVRIKSESLTKQLQFLETKLDKVAASVVNQDETDSRKFKNWLAELVAEFENNPSLWQPLRPVEVTTNANESFQIHADDNSILLTDPPKKHQTINVRTGVNAPGYVKAFRMEALPDEKNSGLVGRSAGGQFSASVSMIHHANANNMDPSVVVRPRFIRIELDGKKILSLAEVQAFAVNELGEETNVALKGTTSQSSVDYDGPSENAIDGNTSGNHNNDKSISHTKLEKNPWWELDLGGEFKLDRIAIWNRTDGKLGNRLNGLRVVFFDNDRKRLFSKQPTRPSPSTTLEIPESISAFEQIPPAKIAFGQADRWATNRFSSGRPARYLDSVWRSGPTKWQLPVDETSLPHTAVYHLEQAIRVNQNDQLVFIVKSSDVGRIRFSVSSNSRAVVGDSAINRELRSALEDLSTGQAINALTQSQSNAVKSAYYQFKTLENNLNANVKRLRDRIADCHSGLTMTMISQPVPANKMRTSRVFPRGDWKDHSGEIVVPNTPHFLPGFDPQPKTRLNRLDLANWLTSADNPLTARHYVNRTWKHFFGIGMSDIPDDLGNQGEWPSHPLLLDWLARQFQTDWDRKRITRMIVTSNTYRQKAGTRNELLETDPNNRLLAQQSPRRLEAEVIRDNALAIAGLLQTDWVGGSSVFPYQPPGYYSNLQFPNRAYKANTDGLQYRRGVYMHWQRTFLHPMLTNFDAPSRDECVADRTLSNSPQQALTLLNDPVFVEASRSFATRLIRSESEPDFVGWIKAAYKLALARDPSNRELEGLNSLYQAQLEHYRQNPDQAKSFNQVGQFRPEIPMEAEQLAALSQVCRVIMNLHEVITRY